MYVKKLKIKPFNVLDNSKLPEIMVDSIPVGGDPVEIEKEMYYACETRPEEKDGAQEIGVKPLAVRNPAMVTNIRDYINCLTISQRRISGSGEITISVA